MVAFLQIRKKQCCFRRESPIDYKAATNRQRAVDRDQRDLEEGRRVVMS